MSSVVVTADSGDGAQVPPAAPPAAPPPARRNRAHYVDRLRAGLTALVVAHHVFYASTMRYGDAAFPLGRAAAPGEVGLSIFSAFFLAGNQAWFMGFFFLISGVFAAPSLRRKGSWAYLKDRALRLLVPGAIYCAFVIPAALAIARAAGGASMLPTFDASPSNAFVWWWKVAIFPFPNGPVWFTFLLWWFDVLLVAGTATAAFVSRRGWLRRCRGGGAARAAPTPLPTVAAAPAAAAAPKTGAPTEKFTTRQTLAGGAALMAAIFGLNGAIRCIPSLGFNGWVHVPMISFMPGYVLSYFLLFVLGAKAHASNALARLPTKLGLASLVLGLVVYPLVGLFFLLPGAAAAFPAQTLGHAAGILLWTAWETAFAVLWSFGLLVAAREWLNAPPGAFTRVVVGAAYAVYLIHPLVETALFAAFGATALPWTACAFIIAGLALPASWAVGAALKALPGAGYML